MIKASMIAYSTAVGPSSDTRNRLMLVADRSMMAPQLKKARPALDQPVRKAYPARKCRQELARPIFADSAEGDGSYRCCRCNVAEYPASDTRLLTIGNCFRIETGR
jgi:hypothetical protein